jgi:SAM-dependent methyltransferase
MQNYVHRTPEAARAVARGELSLATCRACGFSWNASFDPARLEYDAGYDNAVPSAVMDRHYDDTALALGRRHALARGYVVDVGCGNGTFLKALCRVWPECRALGVDPALPADEVHADGRVRLIKGVFSPQLLDDAPSLFVSRHVLEHMPRPVDFVRELRDAIGDTSRAPLFVEVPDLEWILEHRAFWDFCYEHCNYFTNTTLSAVLSRAGFEPTLSGVTFGRQYRWMEAAPAAETVGPVPDETVARYLREYAQGEESRVRAIRERLRDLRLHGRTVAVWGMATKGIMFSLMVDPDSNLLDYTVDVNTNKQGCFVPISGRRIDAPSVLKQVGGRPAIVVVMNPNYVSEIAAMCRGLGVTASYVDAAGQELLAA